MHGIRPRRTTAGCLVGVSAAALALSALTPIASAAQPSTPAVAPYMEMAGPNVGNLSAGIDAGLTSVTAAFVIGKKCTPLWDDGSKVSGNSGVAAAIQNAEDRGVEVIVSFGGAGGKDLARTCTNAAQLTDAYQSVIVTFDITHVDFDVEGAAIEPNKQKASIARRFAAIRSLESEDPDLVVSVTIGVGQDGLPADQMSFLNVAKTSNTRLDLVNIMTMDYGGAVGDMGAAAVQAAQHTLTQVQTLWPADTYANIGITPMIGQNDSAGEITTLTDAQTIETFASQNGVGRLAFWSLNRDQKCGKAAAEPPSTARNNCSGVKQSPMEFTETFLGGA